MTNNAIRLFLAAAATAALTACGGSGSTTSTIPVTSVTIYNAHSVAFKNNSTMAWGYNGSGQLGNGVTNTSNTPVSVLEDGRPLTGLKGISAGSAHTLAFYNNSTVRAWGANFSGQLGNDTTSNGVLTPVKVVGLSKVSAVAAGGNHSLALSNYTSAVYSWGANYAGQLGDNTILNRQKPVQVTLNGAPFGHVKQIAAGGSHSLALKTDGTVWAWGHNDFGQLGQGGTIIASSSQPVPVVGLASVKLIAAGGAFSVAVVSGTPSDTVWVWGYNGFGQLGLDPKLDPDPTKSQRSTPQQVTGITGTVEAVSAGLDHILVLVNNVGTRTVWGWGFKGFGQLGGVTKEIKPEEFTPTPMQISGLTGAFDPVALTVNGMSPILAIGHHSMARTDSGLFAWGNNNYGQLGVTPGSPTYEAKPTKVGGL